MDGVCCGVCGKILKNNATLRRHHEIHENRQRYRCDACGARFNQQSALINHRKVHSNVRRYVCDICRASFKRSHNRTNHIKRVHRPRQMDVSNENPVRN